MRPIKFRAFDESLKRWRYFTLDNIPTYLKAFNKLLLDGVEFYLFTGLKDKNGKPIYEGDIILCASRNPCKHIVKWMKGVPADNIVGRTMPGFYLDRMKANYDFVGSEEIIGNTTENPELLAQK